jgi:hypothetical protein
MKKSTFIVVLLVFIGITAFGQTKKIKGTITAVHPYNDQYQLTIHDSSFVLMVDPKDVSRKKFIVKKRYRDLLIQKKGEFELNPKYANKTFILTYYQNGKGWNCIKTIEASK